METKVVNIHSKEPYDVFIGRPSKWGNPFVIGRDGSREEVLDKYLEWLAAPEQAYLIESIHELYDKKLGCFCAPQPCHGDVLAEAASKT